MSGRPPSDDLADQAEPLHDGPNLDVPLASIKLPPDAIAREMLEDEARNASEPEAEREVATLDFFGEELPTWTHPLRYRFRWQGQPIEKITVTQLTTAQVGDVFRRARAEKRAPEIYEVYALMTGLPAKVLRALPAVDGDPITEKCWDFLPPSLLPEPASKPT